MDNWTLGSRHSQLLGKTLLEQDINWNGNLSQIAPFGVASFMIWESHYWKEDLVRLSSRLRKRAKQRRWPERSLATLEKEIFVVFYAIRKLVEARKLSERIVKQHVPLEAFKYSGKQRITLLNWNRKFGDAYEFSKPKRIKVPLTLLCNQIIHSYVFKEMFDEHGMLSGVFISSDRERSRRLLFIEIGEVSKLYARVGKDYPSHAEYHFDTVSGDYLVRNW
jgi:hypothetical protein